MKIFSIFFLFSVLLLIPTQGNVNACSEGTDYEELRYMIFNPDLIHDKAWWTYFYNNKLEYLDGYFYGDHDERILAEEWRDKLQAKATVDEIEEYLFGDDRDSVRAINPFHDEIQHHTDSKKYFDIAQQSQALSGFPDVWDEETLDTAQAPERNALIDVIRQHIPGEPDEFLRKKYIFQLLKLAFYANDTTLFDSVYNVSIKPVRQKSILDWWAVHYKSMLLEQSGHLDSANYLHALAFSHADSKMLISKRLFSRRNLAGVLSLAQNDEEKADIYVLAEVINPGRSLDQLKKIYALSPTHKHLKMLVGREVNKIEDWLGSSRFNNSRVVALPNQMGAGPNAYERDRMYLRQFIGSLENMSTLRDAAPDYIHLALANLNLMNEDVTNAKKHIAAVTAHDADIEFQKNIFAAVIITLQKDITLNGVQQELGDVLQTLLDNRRGKFEVQKILYSLLSYLRTCFARRGMIHLAGLLDNYSQNKFCYSCGYSFEYSMISYLDQYASPEDVEKIVLMFNRKDKNRLEDLLLKPYSNKNYIYDLLGSLYLRKGDVEHALKAFQSIPDEFWFSFSNATTYLDVDPFVYNEELLATRTMTTYNKREIVERLLALQLQAEKDTSKQQQNYFLLGNAWYNFTENAWFMLGYRQSSYDETTGIEKVAMQRAKVCYEKSIALATRSEDRVKLNYMLALLSEGKDRHRYAVAYEQFETTEFYGRKNCLTLYDMVH